MQLHIHDEDLLITIKQVEILHQYSLQIEPDKRYLMDMLISEKLSDLSSGLNTMRDNHNFNYLNQ